MPREPVQHNGAWWMQRDDGTWMRWHEGAWWIPRTDGTWMRWDAPDAAQGDPNTAWNQQAAFGAQQRPQQAHAPHVQPQPRSTGPIFAMLCGLLVVVGIAGYFMVFSGDGDDKPAVAGGTPRATPTRTVSAKVVPTPTASARAAPKSTAFTQTAPTQTVSAQAPPKPSAPAPSVAIQAVPTPTTPAQAAAAQPDFQTGFFPFKSDYAPGEGVSFSVIYAMNGKVNGPVSVTLDFPTGIGDPTETMNFGFSCDKQAGASAQGGWRWMCTKPELFDGGEQMTLSMTAPTTPGNFTFKTTIAPVGTTDRDDSDNAAEMTLTVK